MCISRIRRKKCSKIRPPFTKKISSRKCPCGKIFERAFNPCMWKEREREREREREKKKRGNHDEGNGFFPTKKNSGTFENIGLKLC